MTDAWEGERVARWIASASRLEPQLAPVSDVLFGAADLQPGERVLDVGCGTGPTTHRAAALVGSTGAVTGLDLSPDMIAAAVAAEPDDPEAAPIEWVAADATAWPGPDEPVDAVVSRFGVMFFEDPTSAFANLQTMTRPGGRLVVAVWAHRRHNPLFEVPLSAVLAVRDGFGLPPAQVPPPDAGPFSMADRDAVQTLLADAGWADVAVTEHALRLPLAGGVALDEAAKSTLEVGPSRVVTADMDTTQRAAAAIAIAEALAPYVDGSAVMLDARIQVVTATNP